MKHLHTWKRVRAGEYTSDTGCRIWRRGKRDWCLKMPGRILRTNYPRLRSAKHDAEMEA